MSCAARENVLIVHVCSRAVFMQLFCPALSIVPRVKSQLLDSVVRRAESQLGLLGSVVRRAERLCKDEL